MSSTRDSASESLRRSCNDFARSLARLPVSIIQGISRAMSRRARRRNPQNLQIQRQPEGLPFVPEELFFFNIFEQQYGGYHPFFYGSRFTEALRIADREGKLLFLYLHAPEHPYTEPFCRRTLCSDVVVEFLDANFVSWGAVCSRGEGVDMAASLQAGSFPFCAIVAPASNDSIVVRESLQKDQERERAQKRLQEGVATLAGKPTANNELHQKQSDQRAREATKRTQIKETTRKETTTSQKTEATTKIMIRFPNGERRQQNFHYMDTVRAIYKYIDSLGIPGIGNYQLVSSYPRKIYGHEQLEMTLRDAGFHPSATLYLEQLQ